jgi:CRP-like cAMP-binding protein
MTPGRVVLLQGMPIFGALHDDALACLLEGAPIASRAAGEYFFREGEEALSMFVLEQGAVEVLKRWQDRLFPLHRLGAGDCFGEMALMDLMPRSASVKALADCSAIEIRPEHLHGLFKLDAEQFALVQMNMGREVSRRLRAADELLFRAGMEAATDGPESLFRAT